PEASWSVKVAAPAKCSRRRTSTRPCVDEGSVASFRLRRLVVWSRPPTQGAKEARDEGEQLPRGSLPSRHAADGGRLPTGATASVRPSTQHLRHNHAQRLPRGRHSVVVE